MDFLKRRSRFYFLSFLKHDFKASITVFFVALPLCLGIALASGAPLYAGLLSGIIGGLIVAAVMVTGTMYCYYSGEFVGSMMVGYASMILAFSMIFVALKQIRDKQYDGSISFGKAFKAALLITLVTSTIYVVVWLFCYYVFIPDFITTFLF